MPINAENELQLAIEQLYRVFEHYRGQDDWSDPFDNKPASENALLTINPVRLLPPLTFHYYSWHAISMFPHNLPALKYFLPRIAESYSQPKISESDIQNDCDIAPAMLIRELNAVNWLTWPPDEVASIRTFFQAWFKACINDPHIQPHDQVGISRWLMSDLRYQPHPPPMPSPRAWASLTGQARSSTAI